MQRHLNGSPSTNSFQSWPFSFFSFLINIFILATGSFCIDSNVRTLLLEKALWISLKIFSLLFSSSLIFTVQRRWLQWRQKTKTTYCRGSRKLPGTGIEFRSAFSGPLLSFLAVRFLNHPRSLVHLTEDILGSQVGSTMTMGRILEC